MANFTNLPERHFVDKAKKLSFGDQDKDTYFDGETLDDMLTAISDLQKKSIELSTSGSGMDDVSKAKRMIQNGVTWTPRYLVYRTLAELSFAIGSNEVKLIVEMFTASTSFSPIVIVSLNTVKDYAKNHGINVSTNEKRIPCSGYYAILDDGLKYYPINQFTMNKADNSAYVTAFINGVKTDITLPSAATIVKSSNVEWIS